MTLTTIEILHCNATGQPVGESHGMARHGNDVVAKAREMHAGGMGYKPIGKALGVAWPTVQSWIGKSGNKRRNVDPVRIKAQRRVAPKVETVSTPPANPNNGAGVVSELHKKEAGKKQTHQPENECTETS